MIAKTLYYTLGSIDFAKTEPRNIKRCFVELISSDFELDEAGWWVKPKETLTIDLLVTNLDKYYIEAEIESIPECRGYVINQIFYPASLVEDEYELEDAPF